MNDEVRRELLETARVFWRRQPWRRLEDTHNFGLRDAETGQIACGVVLGHAGYQYGLVLYLGAEGFEVARRLALDEMDREGLAYDVDFLALYFTPEEDIPLSDRKRMGVVGEIDTTGYVVLPNVTRKRPAAAETRPDDGEARFLARALRTVARLVATKRLTPERLKDRSTLPLFVLSARMKDSILEEVAPRPSGHLPGADVSPPAIPAPLLANLLRRPKSGRLLATLTLGPGSVKGEQTRMLLVYDEEKDRVLDCTPYVGPRTIPDATLRFLGLLSGDMPPRSAAEIETPAEVWTDSVEFYRVVKDALEEAGIEILCLEKIEELDQLRESLMEFMSKRKPARRGPAGREGEFPF